MTARLDYFRNLKRHLRLDSSVESDVIRELNTYLEDKSQELRESGLAEDESTKNAIKLLGSPRLVARQIYEVYSQGSWRQALFAALPHLLVALLFALHWWQSTIWLLGLLVAVICVVIYGWCHGKPAWLFPWLGYCLTPVIVVGTLLINLPGAWAWLAAIVYVPLALIGIFLVAKQSIKRDWLFASLMFLPVPAVLGWRIGLGVEDMLQWHARLCDAAHWIALSFMVLAVTVATFIRIKQRWAKAGALLLPQILVLIMVALVTKDSIRFWLWLFLTLLALLLLFSPALLERKIRED